MGVHCAALASHLFGRNRACMKVHVPTPLRSYTNREAVVSAAGSTVAEVLADIERQFPGFRFRIIDEQDGIREHIKIFVNEDQVQNINALAAKSDVLHIICALSGGNVLDWKKGGFYVTDAKKP